MPYLCYSCRRLNSAADSPFRAKATGAKADQSAAPGGLAAMLCSGSAPGGVTGPVDQEAEKEETRRIMTLPLLPTGGE